MEPANILVIDDEVVICDGCKWILSERGHCVRAARDGRSGLQALRSEPCDLILLDLKLPDIDGMQLLDTIRKESGRIAVVVMTGYSSVQGAVQAMKLGAFDYLSKPFSDEQLVLAVERAVQTKRLADENLALRKQLFGKYDFDNIIGEDPKILKIFSEIRKAAPLDTTILLEGESGVGKELFAKAIHAHSRRTTKQFVILDCSTFSSSLLESELFGHVKGAFTGATCDTPGVLEAAHGGTLFLDEVANLCLEVQSKLLRAMETHEYKPVGCSVSRKADIRIIAATNQNLERLVEQGRFRTDLFFRLSVLPIYIPPLRERREDIPKLAYHFLRRFCKEMSRRIQGFTDEALGVLIDFDWPGNVRQLKNVVERLVILTEEKLLDSRHLLDQMQTGRFRNDERTPRTLKELRAVKKNILEQHYARIEEHFLRRALAEHDGNITRAAGAVGMQRSNFSRLLKKHSLSSTPTPSGKPDGILHGSESDHS